MRRELIIGLLIQSIIMTMAYFFDAPDLFLFKSLILTKIYSFARCNCTYLHLRQTQ